MLFESPAWAVVESRGAAKASAVVFHLVKRVWVPDRSASVSLTVIEPEGRLDVERFGRRSRSS